MSMRNNSILMLLTPAVLCAWGLSWSITKLALDHAPPLWLGFFRLAFGCLVLFAALLISGRKFWPTRQDLPLLLSVGLAQMGGFTMLIILGLTHVEAGRSAILVYTTPLWVAPIAVLFFKESLHKLTLLGIVLGIFGVLWLFNPMNFNWSDSAVLIGNGLLLLAAIVWSMVILHVRFSRNQRNPLELAPWQMLIGAVFVLITAGIFEPWSAIQWSWQFAGELGYLGPIATAFAYWGVIKLNRELPAITTSLLLLAVPVIGLVLSEVILGEAIHQNTLIAMTLILLGLACMALAKHPHYSNSKNKGAWSETS